MENLEKEHPKEFQIGIGVNVFIFNEKGQLLLSKRLKTNSWCLPGGKLEFMENWETAAKRETLEETGISIEDLEWLHIINEPDPIAQTHWIHVNYIAKKYSGTPAVIEVDKFSTWEWFDLDELPPNIFAGHRLMIKTYQNKAQIVDLDSAKKKA
jgi:8-oxo-dGTP diphosphatase